jgi:orotidine-5'-phosphate decarboxylase
MDRNFADELLDAIAEKGSPVCVGLDPVFEKLPETLRRDTPEEVEQVEMLEEFCEGVLEAVAPFVPAVKIQSAYFERYGPAGVGLYNRMIARAIDMDLLVIGDVKRNDIGPTAQAYAQGHLRALQTSIGPTPDVANAITVNGYFGADGLTPFIDMAAAESRGVFVLVRTSNPSAGQVQDFADANGSKLYEHVARLVARIGDGEGLVGESGYSCVGAVVGATWPDQARQLREIMPRQIFLVPGFGAQGATADDCAASFKADGTGAIVNSSRGVIFAFWQERFASVDWKQAVAVAAEEFAAQIRKAVFK